MAARKGEQSKGLIVQVETRVADLPVAVDDGCHCGVSGDEIFAEIIKRMPSRLEPWPVPAKPACLAVGKRHPRNRSRTVRSRQRCAVEVDRFMESAMHAVRTQPPPQWQRHLEQPAPELRRLIIHAHAGGASISRIARLGKIG